MAGKRIAGITIEIGGDSKGLIDSLKGVDSQTKKTQDNLKDINKLLKFDPKNTELLTQKQKNLQSAIKSTKDRLKTLQEAQSDDMPVEQQEALKREIIETEQKLESLEKEYKDFGSVGKQQIKAVQSQIKEAGKKVTKFGKDWSKYVTAPIVAAGGLAYKSFTEVDEGLDTIVKKTGATGKSLEDMGGIMKNIATTIPTDFATAGAAVGEVNTRFGLTGQELEDLSAKFIKFASLNDTDVSSAIDSVQAAMAQFGVSSEQAGNVLNMLNKAAQDTGIPVDKLSSSLLSNGTALQEMGLKIGPSINLLANLEKNGIDSSTAMAGFKKALANATKEGKPLQEALAEVQAGMEGAATNTEAAQIATDLFGAKAGPAIAQAVREGRLSLDEMGEALGDWGNNIENTFDATLSPADQFNVAMNDLKVLGADIAEEAMPLLTSALEKVRDVISTLREKWSALTDQQKGTILKIVGVVAAIGPLATALGGVITLLSGPGGIVVAIGLVVAAGIWLVNHWDEVKEAAKKLWEKVKGFFSAGVKTVSDAITTAWNGVKKVGKDVWDGLISTFKSVGNWFGKMGDAFETVRTGKLKPVFDWVDKYFITKFKNLKAVLEGIIEFVKDVFAGDWEGAWDDIVEAFGTVFGNIKDLMKDPINAVIDGINWMIDAVEKAINGVIKGINKHVKIHIDPISVSGIELFKGLDWGANLKEVKWNRVKKLAEGGTLGEGGRAIVGEYAPEFLTVRNGQAIVTPIQGAQRWGQGDTINNTFQIIQQPGENANALAERVIRIMTRQQEQRNNAYA